MNKMQAKYFGIAFLTAFLSSGANSQTITKPGEVRRAPTQSVTGAQPAKPAVISMTPNDTETILFPGTATQLRVARLDPANPRPDPRQALSVPVPGISFGPGKPSPDKKGHYFTVVTKNAPLGHYQLFALVGNQWSPVSPQAFVVTVGRERAQFAPGLIAKTPTAGLPKHGTATGCAANPDPNVPIPRVTSWGPQPNGHVNGEITFNGTNFIYPGFCAKLGGQFLQILSGTATKVVARLPQQRSRPGGQLVVSHGTAASEFVLSQSYSVLGQPTVSRVTPNAFGRGDIVTLEGFDLEAIYPKPRRLDEVKTMGFVKISDSPSEAGVATDAPVGWTVGGIQVSGLLLTTDWSWATDGNRATFRAGDIWEIVRICNPAKTIECTNRYNRPNPQPAQLGGPLRLATQGTSGYGLVAGNVTLRQAVMAITKVSPPAWGTTVPNFVIVPKSQGFPGINVTIEGSGLHNGVSQSEAFMGGQKQTTSISSHGMNGFVGVMMSTPSDYITLTYAGGASARSPAILNVIPGPDVIPPAGNSPAGPWTFKVDQDITLQGWDLKPRGNVSGLGYALVMSGLVSQEVSCRIRLTISEHTPSAIKFRVSRTGEIPATCLQTTLFKPQGGTYTVMQISASYNGVTREFWRMPYYLVP